MEKTGWFGIDVGKTTECQRNTKEENGNKVCQTQTDRHHISGKCKEMIIYAKYVIRYL